MNPSNVSVIIDILTFCVIIGIGFFMKSYFPSYLEKKGENLATREDIEEIAERTERGRQRQRQREETVKAISEYLMQFARLIELYRLMAHGEGHLIPNDQGELVWEVKWCEPDPRKARAFEEKEEISIRSAIYQTVITIRLRSGEIADLTDQIDPTGGLNKQFADLFNQIEGEASFSLKQRDFRGLAAALRQAGETRREISAALHNYLTASDEK